MNNITASSTTTALRHTFAAYGLPVELVSDNGPQYTPASKSILAQYWPNIGPILATNWQPMPIMPFRYQYWPNAGYHQ